MIDGISSERVQQEVTGKLDALSARQAGKLALIEETMTGIREMAAGFASAMIDHHMPATMVTEELREDGRLSAKIVHPAWIVVKGTNLSGLNMTHAEVESTTCSYSLLSHTAHDFRTHYAPIDLDEIHKHRFDPGDKLRYQANAIAVNAEGALLRVTQFDRSRAAERHFWFEHLDYKLQSGDMGSPESLFSIERFGPAKSKRVLMAMRKRIDSATEEYAAKQADEEDDVAASRALDYYQSKLELMDDPKNRKHFLRPQIIRGLRHLLT